MKFWKKSHPPAALIVIACLLWATDSLVRYPTALQLDHKIIVFFEHVVGLVFITPWVLFRFGPKKILPAKRDWKLIAIVGIGGSALGDYFFTQAIGYIGPSTATLFQMMQPALVVALAYQFLKERHNGVFFQCALWVIINAVVLSFANFDFGFPIQSEGLQRGIVFALLAMLMWGAATVAGKALLFHYAPPVVVFWRWVTAALFIGIWMLLRGTEFPWQVIFSKQIFGTLLFLGTIVGVFAMTIYYHGLQRLPASVATFIELIYALAGILIPAVYYGKQLSFIEMFGTTTLLLMIFALSGLADQVKIAK